MPRISVIMSTFNGARDLRESMASVLAQTMNDFEFLIVDDASSDGSAEILRKYQREDPRVSFIQNTTNAGLFKNLNILIRKCSSPLIKLWSQDDIMLPHCLERGLEFHKEHPEIGCFYVNCDYLLEPSGKILPPPADATPSILSKANADFYALKHGCLSANISNLFFPKKVFDVSGYFREDLIGADFEMMVRIQEGFPIGRIPEILLHLRRHQAQWSRQPGSSLRFMRENIEIYGTLAKRVTEVHQILSAQEAEKILLKRFGVNGFHEGLQRFFHGDFKGGLCVFRQLKRIGPLSLLGWIWLTDFFGCRLWRKIHQ